MAEQTIICPNCGKRIPVSKALADQIESELRKDFDTELKQREEEVKSASEKRYSIEIARREKQIRNEAMQEANVELIGLRKDLAEAQKREKTSQFDFEKKVEEERKKLEQETTVKLIGLRQELAEAQKREKKSQDDFESKLEVERKKLEQKSRQEAQAEVIVKMADLEKQIREKNEKIKEAEENELEVKKLKFKLAAREKKFDTEIAQKVKKAIEKTEEDVSKRIESDYRIRELQLEKKLSDAKNKAAELKRKLDQSSQQAQGEVIELELESALKNAFPEDEILPIEKGQAGADIIQNVRTPNGQLCGTIIWETKNTKNWSKTWLSKLRSDQRKIKADVAVLVTIALPKEVKQFALVEGIWVAEYSLALGVASALRATIIQVAMVKQTVKGKHETLQLLYDYLSSLEFRHRIEAMVESFQGMRDDLNKERQMMEKQWAKRDKQIELVVQNVSGMYGDMHAIVGQALPKIRKLELPELQTGQSGAESQD
ncbi:MAG: DUF2130 domain-containing protein [Anaerolineales bacterium]|jgi:hypothetical protein